jgi:hypothetical protein
LKLSIDRLKNSVQVPIDVAVPKTKNFESLIRKASVACAVQLCVGIDIVLAAINLDNQSMAEAYKIENIAGAG